MVGMEESDGLGEGQIITWREMKGCANSDLAALTSNRERLDQPNAVSGSSQRPSISPSIKV